VTLRLVGIEGKAVEEFLALCAAGFGGPLGESAGEVVGDGAAEISYFNAFVVERVHQVSRHLLAAGALIAFQDHTLILSLYPLKPG
jgi:hypothetical protein